MTEWTTLISAEALRTELGGPQLAVVDCRFDLRDPAAGSRLFPLGHIAGATYASLDNDLSDLGKTGRGRHPLPDVERFCAALGRMGITPQHQVVVYDGLDGSIAARFWWMLNLLGHRRVAVLDGGLEAWIRQGGAMSTGNPRLRQREYKARYQAGQIVTTAVLAARLASGDALLIDARARERFRGEVEPLDPVAGHIPGARNRPFTENLDAAGGFKTALQLRLDFERLLAGKSPSDTILMCGSGVTACHNLLAMTHSGLPGAKVYAGSWSEWCSDRSRPIARGDAG